jgi:hypothetical protein
MGAAAAQNSRERCLHWPGGPVAQLVEQGTFNPKVTGSIPVRPMPRGSPARCAGNDDFRAFDGDTHQDSAAVR